MNERVVPRLLGLEFLIVPSGGSAWQEGDYFRRSGKEREQIIRIGRQTFGNAIGLNVARQREDGSYEYLKWHEKGLAAEQLRYSSQEELDAVLNRLLSFLDSDILPWLGAP